MTGRVHIRVQGTPAPKGSRIPGRRRDGTVFTRPAGRGEKAWAETVAAMALPYRGTLLPPYEVELTFYMARPKRPAWLWPSRNDLDKLVRCCLDGLVVGGVLADDRHVTGIHAVKRWPLPASDWTGVDVVVRGVAAANGAEDVAA